MGPSCVEFNVDPVRLTSVAPSAIGIAFANASLDGVNTHAPPVHAYAPLAGFAGHAMQPAPHWLVLVSGAQKFPHGWKPALQAMPHIVPSHVALPFAGTKHAPQDMVPQLATLVFETHAAPHGW